MSDADRVRRFEDLIAWQKARVLAKDVYRLTKQPWPQPDYKYLDQLRGAAVSVMSNIAEGFERGSASEFHRFLTIAKSSCAELRSHLYIGVDTGGIPNEDFERLLPQAEEVSRIIGGLRTAVGKRRK